MPPPEPDQLESATGESDRRAVASVKTPPPMPMDEQPPELPPSFIDRLLSLMKREPVLFVSTTYILVSALGLWSSYWYYAAVGLPVLEYLQAGDLFVTGLRNPWYLLILLACALWVWISAWPTRWGERNPRRAAWYRQHRWWGRIAFPDPNSWALGWGVRSNTLVVAATGLLVLSILYVYNHNRPLIEARSEPPVEIILLGHSAPLPGDPHLLGTSVGYAFVWWPQQGRVEALPLNGVQRIAKPGLTLEAVDVAADAKDTAEPDATAP